MLNESAQTLGDAIGGGGFPTLLFIFLTLPMAIFIVIQIMSGRSLSRIFPMIMTIGVVISVGFMILSQMSDIYDDGQWNISYDSPDDIDATIDERPPMETPQSDDYFTRPEDLTINPEYNETPIESEEYDSMDMDLESI